MAPKVTLISTTPDAATLLIFSKNTRLNLSPTLYEEIQHWHQDRIDEELAYMASTIRSSWEFVDVVFLIEGVTRACAQQMTRTRTASYAMQSQRVTNASEMEIANPYPKPDDPEEPNNYDRFDQAARAAKRVYNDLVGEGSKLEDARGVLPMNTTCNLIAKYNLRSFADILAARKSFRAQGEYADIVLQMEALVLQQWPWAAKFFEPAEKIMIELLESVVKEIGITTGHGPGWQVAKVIDLLRKS